MQTPTPASAASPVLRSLSRRFCARNAERVQSNGPVPLAFRPNSGLSWGPPPATPAAPPRPPALLRSAKMRQVYLQGAPGVGIPVSGPARVGAISSRGDGGVNSRVPPACRASCRYGEGMQSSWLGSRRRVGVTRISHRGQRATTDAGVPGQTAWQERARVAYPDVFEEPALMS